MSLRPQEPHKKNDHSNQNRRKQGRPCPRVLSTAFICIAFISAHVLALLSAVYLPVMGTHLPSKGSPLPFRVLPCQLQDKVIQDQANEDDIHQHPGKNDAVSKILFV